MWTTVASPSGIRSVTRFRKGIDFNETEEVLLQSINNNRQRQNVFSFDSVFPIERTNTSVWTIPVSVLLDRGLRFKNWWNETLYRGDLDPIIFFRCHSSELCISLGNGYGVSGVPSPPPLPTGFSFHCRDPEGICTSE